MSLFHATTQTNDRPAAQKLSDALELLDPAPLASGIHDHDDGTGIWEVSAYFDGRPDSTGLALLASANGTHDFQVVPVETRDWVAQVREGLVPVRAGRFIVHGSHDRDKIPTHLIALEIEAALAFGTGHHATTQGCLIALDALVREGFVPGSTADIGGGTGVLAMAAARVFPGPVIASDIDPQATLTARENIIANNLNGRIRCVTAPGFNHPELRAGAPYGLILSNILAGPLKRLAPEMSRYLAPGGTLVLSGILTRQAKSVEAVYRSFGLSRKTLVRREEWSVLVMTKRRG